MRRVILFALGLAVAPVVACHGSPPSPTSQVIAGIRTINASELKSELDGGKVKILVDVRTPEEFSTGHVPGAVNIPLDQLSGRMSELASYQPGEVHLICRSGNRSLAASQSLLSKGYTPVNVAGGTEAWKQSGYAVN